MEAGRRKAEYNEYVWLVKPKACFASEEYRSIMGKRMSSVDSRAIIVPRLEKSLTTDNEIKDWNQGGKW